MGNTLVSILIPVYNRVSLVGETIESARNQTYQNIEIVIVDNCSTDGTWELLKDFALKDNRIRIFQNSENIGPVKNWKRCIEEANGEFSKILFSDDLIESNFLEETIKLLDDKTAFVLSKIKIIKQDNDLDLGSYKYKKVYSVKDFFQSTLLMNIYNFPVSPGCALFRTSDLRSSLEIDIPNPFSLDFKKYGAGNDLLLFLNTAKNYSYVKVALNTISYFRAHKNSLTVSNNLNINYDYSRLYFIEQNFPKLLSKFKTKLWLRNKRDGRYNPIINCIDSKLDFYFLLNSFFKIIFNQQNFTKNHKI